VRSAVMMSCLQVGTSAVSSCANPTAQLDTASSWTREERSGDMMFQIESCYNLSCVLKKCNMTPGSLNRSLPQQASALRPVSP
jgi:hypothetical protein